MKRISNVAVGVCAGLALVAAQAHSATLVLDDFSAPGGVQSVVAPSQNFVQSTTGVFAGVAGQTRDAYYWPYVDPMSSGATATIGGGSASVSAGPGVLGEYAIGYGAYGIDLSNPGVQGPALGLDLTKYTAVQAVFSHVEQPVNLVVSFYTINPKPGTGLYYWDQEITVGPTIAGGPMTANLMLDSASVISGAPDNFNFKEVDGIVFLIDRAAADTYGNSYSLNTLQFTDAVPEPETYAMMMAGLGLLGALTRRRKTCPN